MDLVDIINITLLFIIVILCGISEEAGSEKREWQKKQLERKRGPALAKKQLERKRGPALPSSQRPLDAVWQPVARTRNQFFVYSAFVERRNKLPAIRVVGATSRFKTDRVFCRLWLHRSGTPHVLNAIVKHINEHHDRQHTAVFVLCLLDGLNPEKTINGSIAIVSSAAEKHLATNLIKIIDTTPKNHGEQNLHICVRPLFGFTNVNWMVEWIELNRILGASHFYFYNMSINEQLDHMFRKYPEQKDLFTVLPFPVVFKDIWAEGQLVSMHDCLYRSMSRADWLMLIDIDEVVLPHEKGLQRLQDYNSKPLLALFDELIKDSDKKHIYMFVFRHALFYMDFKDDPKSPVPLVTARKTRRIQLLNQFYIRSKYAVRPSKAIELSIHVPFKFENNVNIQHVSAKFSYRVAMLHHYRRDCILKVGCTEDEPSIIDRTAQVWADLLWKRVQKKLTEIKHLCQLPDKPRSPHICT